MKIRLSALILCSLPTVSPVLSATYEDAPFISAGVTFIDDLEVATIELGAEVAPNINWSIGYSSSVGESVTEDEVTLNETRKLSWGIHTALGYEMKLAPYLTVTPRIGLNYNQVDVEYFDHEVGEIIESVNHDQLAPTLGLKIDIGSLGIISDFYKVDSEQANKVAPDSEHIATRIMATYNF
ncbi:autotransporter outer membrane beta-barrel domain-containing protein [Photobacterium profundum]|uniref:autotransporter outer membrane beta-barrel domain-containing protein n=1 Tax=Photobacterium profundum TaxID=74109 RepID=UPI00103CFB5B|nr:autotransporter outer membrane beta-barrel domain-containing protein [Photobacterium profundum]